MSPAIDMRYVLDLTKELLAIPSVAGDCREVNERLKKEFEHYGLEVSYTNKGALIAKMEGSDPTRPACFIGAHSDTLGAIVRYIKPNGRPRLFPIGGFGWSNFEGMNCIVRTSADKKITGTILADKASRHAYSTECDEGPRTNDIIEVRLDEDTSSPEETRALGIEVGDFVFFEPRFEENENGFIKSHFLDDKVCIAAIFGAIKAMHEAGVTPSRRVYFNISNYEEVGHGVSYIPEDVNEILSLDIGIVAEHSNSDEHAVSIFARDNITPYDISFRERLTGFCNKENIPYRLDTFNRYSSDASQVVRRGGDYNFAGIGPGIDASHHYERTHVKGIEATARLTMEYILD